MRKPKNTWPMPPGASVARVVRIDSEKRVWQQMADTWALIARGMRTTLVHCD